MNDIFIIANPSSGQNKAELAANTVKNMYVEDDQYVEIHVTSKESDISVFAHEASERLFKKIIVIGGDGTVSILMDAYQELDYKPVVGIIPTGTVNNVARALNIPMNINRACSTIVNGEGFKADLGLVNGQVFSSAVSAGAIPESAANISSEDKERFGPLAYVLSGLNNLNNGANHEYKMIIDGEKYHINLDLLLIGVSSSITGLTQFFQNATFDDGKLHMYGIIQTTISQKISEFSKILTKNNQINWDENSNAFMLSFEELKVDIEEGNSHVTVDGEEGPTFPLEIKVLPEYVTFIVPEKE